MPRTQRNKTRHATARARELRRDQSNSEGRLWSRLRNRRIGFKFKRQYPVGPYVLDFYCVSARLCVELDGQQHKATVDRDRERDRALAERGIRTLRISTADAIHDMDAVLETIASTCRSREPSP